MTAAAVLALVAILVSFFFSQSRESSLPAAWSLSLLPATALVVAALGRAGWRVVALLGAFVTVLASLSLWRLLTSGVSPKAPLMDANNYATLIYLLWFAGTGWHLRRFWEGRTGTPEHMGFLCWSLFLTAVVFAVLSRASSIIVTVGVVAWLLYAWRKRLSLWPIGRLLAAVALGFLLVQPQAGTHGDYGFSAPEMQQGLGIRAALNGAALDYYRDRPWTGIGLNVFPLRYRAERPQADQITDGLSPHNDYLQLLAEGGPLLLLALLVLVVAVGLRALQSILPSSRVSRPVAPDELGLLLALGAALAHASVNFVLMTSVLAGVLGVFVGLVSFESPRVVPSGRIAGQGVLHRAMLVLLSLAYLHLALDCVSAAVYNQQRGVPLVAAVHAEPERLLAFSRAVQRANPHRGVPILAEARIVEMALHEQPDSWFYRQQLLNLYARALNADPWNPNGYLLFHDFLRAYPELVAEVDVRHRPGDLLLRALALDPICLPAYERIVRQFRKLDRPELAYPVVRDGLLPWLPWLYRNDAAAAESFLAYLQDWAGRLDDTATMASLKQQQEAMRAIAP